MVCNAFWICFHPRHHSSTSVHLVIPVHLHFLVHFQWLWIAAFTLDSVWMLYSYSPFQLPRSLVYPTRQMLPKSRWVYLLAVAMELHTGTEHTAHVGLHAWLLGLHLILHLFIKCIVLVPSNPCNFPLLIVPFHSHQKVKQQTQILFRLWWIWKGYARPSLNPDVFFNEYVVQICHFFTLA